jgi:hypothetical protein
MSASPAASRHPRGEDLAKIVPLRYVARAGLLPELTRQTYDSLYKALREAILNSIDAGATIVIVDLASVESDGVLEIADDGSGMSLSDLQQSFMSLGGSQKFGAADMFGRIGIGSLALMHYAQAVEIETKEAGSGVVTKATVSHPWTLDHEQRGQDLADLLAGEAWQQPSTRSKRDHYTKIRLTGVDDVLVRECADVGAYYQLVEQLRRTLPLAWPRTELSDQLARQAPELVTLIDDHTRRGGANVTVRSRWSSDDSLTKRVFGEGGVQEEAWDGMPKAVLRDITVDGEDGPRLVTVAGYLISQARPSADWTGLTARVQNVAVEEHTFFGLESDPGFRKYITGEVWLLGDLDRARLINIDRASFSHESVDYRAIARAMQHEISRFKSEFVQAPRRAKVAIKRRLDQQRLLIDGASRVATAASSLADRDKHGRFLFPSSGNGRLRSRRSRNLLEDLRELGAVVALKASDSFATHPYRLKVASDGRRVLVELDADLAQPTVDLGGRSYRLGLVEARPSDPPVLLKKRPHEIVFNLAHDCFKGEPRQSAIEILLALELAYLLNGRTSEDLYDNVLALVAAP